jgi:hypothetical protein
LDEEDKILYWFLTIRRKNTSEEYTISLLDNVTTFYVNKYTKIKIIKKKKQIIVVLNDIDRIQPEEEKPETEKPTFKQRLKTLLTKLLP